MNFRRWLARLNLAVTLVLLGMLFILVNYIAGRRYARLDVTRTKLSALSPKTIQVLKQLRDPISIIVFYQPQSEEGSSTALSPLIEDLLKEYERYASRLTVERVDPYRDRARAEQLAKQFEIDRLNLVIFQSGTRHKYLSDADLADYDYSTLSTTGAPLLRAFKGEDAFTSAILNVTQATQPLVWATTGHGEKAIDDHEPTGLSALKKRLEQENMRVEPAALLERTAIPAEVSAVVIAGPTRRFAEAELLLLQAYLERGGRVLAMIDPMDDSGLDGLLARWGLELGHDVVVDPARQLPFVSAANLFVTAYTQHPIVEHMQTLMTLFPLARSVTVGKAAEGLQATALAMTSPKGWGETAPETSPFRFDEHADTKGPVSIAAAVESQAGDRTPTTVGVARPTARLVVIGDSDFVSNGQLSNAGNGDLALACLHWLAAQEQLIGISPKPFESTRLNLMAGQMSVIFWFSIALLPCTALALGAAMWWQRRR